MGVPSIRLGACRPVADVDLQVDEDDASMEHSTAAPRKRGGYGRLPLQSSECEEDIIEDMSELYIDSPPSHSNKK